VITLLHFWCDSFCDRQFNGREKRLRSSDPPKDIERSLKVNRDCYKKQLTSCSGVISRKRLLALNRDHKPWRLLRTVPSMSLLLASARHRLRARANGGGPQLFVLQREVSRAQSEDLFHHGDITICPSRAGARSQSVRWIPVEMSRGTTRPQLDVIRMCQ
jgi:hypothetical protein